MKQVLWILLAFVLLCACEEKHFMTDPDYRRMVEQDFQKKKEVLEGNPGNLFAVFDSPMSVEEREALMFLYAYSPLIDLSFSGGDFLLKHVRWAFQAREAMPWGKDIPEDILELYGQLRERILELGNVEIKATKLYVAFTVNGSNFTDIAIQKKALKLWINLPKGGLEDPYKLARDVANIGHHGNGDYQLSISNADKLDYIITLIKQGYQSKI